MEKIETAIRLKFSELKREYKDIEKRIISLKNEEEYFATRDVLTPSSKDIEVINNYLPTSTIKKISKDESVETIINRAIRLAKHFEKMSKASQIINIKNELTALYSETKDKISLLIVELEEKKKKIDSQMLAVKEDDDLLNKVASNTILNAEDLEHLHELIYKYNVIIDDALIESLIELGKKIIINELTSKKTIKESEPLAETIISDEEKEEKKEEPLKTIEDIRTEYAKFLDNHEYQAMDEELFTGVQKCFSWMTLNNGTNITEINDINEMLNSNETAIKNSEELLDYLDLIHEKETISYVFLCLFKSAYEEKDLNRVKNLLNIYQNTSLDYYSTCSKEILVTDEIIRKKLEENYEKWKNLDNSHKNDNMDKVLEIIKEERNDANKENYLYYELFLLKEKINALVKQPNKNKKIEELYKESISLLNEINKLNGYVINEREELTDNKLISMSDNLYQNGFNNYVVFADLNNFNALFNNILSNHKEINIENLLNIMEQLANRNIDYIMRHSSRVLNTKNKGNPYGIRRIRNSGFRVGFKSLEIGKINGHNVYIIINPVYGNTDGKEKSQGYQSNIDWWHSEEDNRVKWLLEALNEKNNKEGLNERAKETILEAINYYKELKKYIRNESVNREGEITDGQDTRKTIK